MRVSRRDCIRGTAAVGAAALTTGCASVIRRATAPAIPDQIALPTGDVEPVSRVLNRVAFGPAPGDVGRIAALGIPEYVDEQLRADEDDDLNLRARLHGIEALHTNAIELGDLPLAEVLRQIQQAAILRAVYSRWQLRERMVDFWTNHFNVFARKGVGAWLIPTQEVTIIRRHALGKFPDLLNGIAHSPAMLAYLDNQVNRRGVPNENYARELMELHTLGVHGGYTQKDVQEVARCLTGWTIEDRFMRARGTFRFDPSLHDDGPKTVLGHEIPAGGGVKDGEDVLDIVAHHPATARHISAKLCRYFLGATDSLWTDRLAGLYAETGGDVPKMLRPLLCSADLARGPAIMKRPLDYLVSAMRALVADTDAGAGAQKHLAEMGQPLYQWPMPDGYPERTTAWTGSLMARWNFAFALASNAVAGTSVDLPGLLKAAGPVSARDCADALLGIMLGHRGDSPNLRPLRAQIEHRASAVTRFARTPLAESVALLLASPQFQWR